MLVDKFTQLNYIGDIWEPHYAGYIRGGSTDMVEVYIAKRKINRNIRDIKLVFTRVGEDSIFAGDWFLRRKDVPKRTKFDNNGMECFVVPWGKFQPLEYAERSEYEM